VTSTPEQRARALANVRHSTALEGRESSAEARTLQDRWVAGEFDADELLRRTAALYDVDVDRAAPTDRR
jgi:hypothetical protein